MIPPNDSFAHETRIRDAYSARLATYRQKELLVKREVTYKAASVRADLRTVDEHDLLREWEFKLVADYSALGQILTYVALARREFQFERQIRGVIAAFEIPALIKETVETMNLGIELVLIPNSLRAAGLVPFLSPGPSATPSGVFIPYTINITSFQA